MDARTLAELRQLAAHLVSLQQQVTDGVDELHRRLSAAEDELVEAQALIRGVAEQGRHLKATS